MNMRFPRNINAQIGFLLLFCVGLFHAIVTAILLFFEPLKNPSAAIVGAALAALNAASPPERPTIAAALNASVPELRLAFTESTRGTNAVSQPLDLRSHLPLGVEIESVDGSDGKKFIGSLDDGQRIALNVLESRPGLRGPVLLTIGFVAITLFVFSLWAALSFTRPLTKFARAAESFSLDGIPAQLPEDGPEEVRSATRALNRMQNRIAAMVAQRTRMLAAVSHDLRTPITRMRLRAEYIGNGDLKTKMLRDLDQMDLMVSACLAYLRGGVQQEMMVFDLASLLQTVVDQFVDVGGKVRYCGADHSILRGSPEDLERAFSNLVDNAVKYAGSAEIRLSEGNRFTIIEVVDEGPGIPLEKRQEMLEPFERGNNDAAPNAREGFGLGLAIARAIIEAHGGRLELDERIGGGLVARAILPSSIETN